MSSIGTILFYIKGQKLLWYTVLRSSRGLKCRRPTAIGFSVHFLTSGTKTGKVECHTNNSKELQLVFVLLQWF